MKLSFFSKGIVFQEVPNEISLSFAIAGCPLHCTNCSWKDVNIKPTELTDFLYIKLLNKYKGLASCVLFLGGDWCVDDLVHKLILAKNLGYKTCLYTGKENVDLSIKKYLDFLKVGPYIEKLGGLSSETTNQKFIDLKTGNILNNYFRQKEAITL